MGRVPAGEPGRLPLFALLRVVPALALQARRRSGARISDNDDLESKLAGFVRSYIHATSGSDPSQQQEALRWVCSGLEYLLGGLPNGCNGWGGWVDGILPATDILSDSVDVISPVALSVRGCALWGKNARGPFWIEPFFGSVQISNASDTIVSYDLKFGDGLVPKTETKG